MFSLLAFQTIGGNKMIMELRDLLGLQVTKKTDYFHFSII